MSNAAFDGISGRIRHWRTRLPSEADLRDSLRYQLVDRFAFVSRPDFVVDADTGATNADRTLACTVTAPSGDRPDGCPVESFDTADFVDGAWFPAAPSGYVVRSYPILRFDGTGALQALFPERVVVETRNVANTLASVELPDDCVNPNCVVQETYTFTGAGRNQHLVGSTLFNDARISNAVFAVNQGTAGLNDACSFREPYGDLYYLTLDVELATGPWAGATDIWVRHYNTGNLSTDFPTPLDQVREVFVFRADSIRRPLPGLVV